MRNNDIFEFSYFSGHMEINMNEFFPCNQSDLKKVINLIVKDSWGDSTEELKIIFNYLTDRIKMGETLIKEFTKIKFNYFDERMKAQRTVDVSEPSTIEQKILNKYALAINSHCEAVTDKTIKHLNRELEKLKGNAETVKAYGNF